MRLKCVSVNTGFYTDALQERYMNDSQLLELQEKLNYRFNDPGLLIKSLTHSSFTNDKTKSDAECNERLEFLGDSLLGMTVALLIYQTNPKLMEGSMTKLRAELVCERSLAELATELDLGSYLIIGKGEESGGGRARPSILADALEAVFAAMYLDGGFEPVMRLISELMHQRISNPPKTSSDYKTMLQEAIQGKQGQTLVYEIVDEQGPDHDKYFTSTVKLNGNEIGRGQGKSKKAAEQEAAKLAVNNVFK